MSETFSTAHGLIAMVELSDDQIAEALAKLPEAERSYAETLSPVRRAEHVRGRSALHKAIAELAPTVVDMPILADDRGAPVLPPGWVGSVSHKEARAAALVTRASPISGARIGVDLEKAAPSRIDISKRVLTANERDTLAAAHAHLEPGHPERGRATTLRFSIKEAIYKAVDPFVRRYVAFTEVELDVQDGVAHVASELPFAIETTWQELDGFWLATARAQRR
ncbi:MAG TPA: 4'-phosphopantetheinyl transferase superfamily protein [Kofleriaceae bacterium]